MSAPPEPQELLLAGWAADGPEQYGTDGDVDQQREQLGLGSGREHPPVTMATASPGKGEGYPGMLGKGGPASGAARLSPSRGCFSAWKHC